MVVALKRGSERSRRGRRHVRRAWRLPPGARHRSSTPPRCAGPAGSSASRPQRLLRTGTDGRAVEDRYDRNARGTLASSVTHRAHSAEAGAACVAADCEQHGAGHGDAIGCRARIRRHPRRRRNRARGAARQRTARAARRRLPGRALSFSRDRAHDAEGAGPFVPDETEDDPSAGVDDDPPSPRRG